MRAMTTGVWAGAVTRGGVGAGPPGPHLLLVSELHLCCLGFDVISPLDPLATALTVVSA